MPGFGRLVNILYTNMYSYDYIMYLIIFEYFIVFACICMNIHVNIDVFKISVIFHPLYNVADVSIYVAMLRQKNARKRY